MKEIQEERLRRCTYINPRGHADYVDLSDFPKSWMNITATIDVEARAKELAVMKLMLDLGLVQ